jgi:hypothetical protein
VRIVEGLDWATLVLAMGLSDGEGWRSVCETRCGAMECGGVVIGNGAGGEGGTGDWLRIDDVGCGALARVIDAWQGIGAADGVADCCEADYGGEKRLGWADVVGLGGGRCVCWCAWVWETEGASVGAVREGKADVGACGQHDGDEAGLASTGGDSPKSTLALLQVGETQHPHHDGRLDPVGWLNWQMVVPFRAPQWVDGMMVSPWYRQRQVVWEP